jgi:hypothetical protein
MYEMFFFEWSVQMRDGQDIAGCFGDARSVYETYHAFVRARRLDERIRESRHRCLSAWDQKILGLRSYPVLEAEMDPDTTFDPFAVVEATADRNYFQQFWEHLLPLLTKGEQKALLNSLQRRYETDFRLPNMVAPAALTRGIR